MSPPRAAWSGFAGVVSAMVTLAVAELATVFVAPASSPLLAIGSLVIDIAPSWVKDLTIAVFGTHDKAVLLACLGILVALLAFGIGLLEFAYPPWGVAGVGAVAAAAIVAVITRTESAESWALPTILGSLTGIAVLRGSIARLHRWADAAKPDQPQQPQAESGVQQVDVSRRQFMTLLGAAAAAAAVVGIASRAVNAGTAAVDSVRSALKLPSPAAPAPPIPPAATLDVGGITPLVTPNGDFYRIDTALHVPRIDADDWRLKITGMVEDEVEIDLAELLALPLDETYVTLLCVSNEVGGDLVGNALWLGYPIRDLLARAKPLPGADMVLSRSIDGFTASTPLSVLLEEDRNSILAVGMNGDPLPIEHGFPVRLVVPGLYGYVSATKWVVELRVTRFADETAYWTDRG